MNYEVTVVWPDIVRDHAGQPVADRTSLDELDDQPRFEWDNWGCLIGGGLAEIDAELRAIGCGPLLDITSDGQTFEDTVWTSPKALLGAIGRMRSLLASESPLATSVVQCYVAVNYHDRPGDPRELIRQDLDLLVQQVEWVRARGHRAVCFAINV